MEFFPLYKEQMEEDELFKKLSPLKKCYYFLLQSMFNKFDEFYYRDMNFAAALKCSDESIKKARPEFVKNGWIKVLAGHQDQRGRGVATTYKEVKWANTPEKDEGKQFAIIPRYCFEMLLRHEMPHDCIVVYIALTYWKHLHQLDDGNFFITKSQLQDITGLKGMNKIDNCIETLYRNFAYSGGSHLFEYHDQYHKFKFTNWSIPDDPSESENNYRLQKQFWNDVVQSGKNLQEIKKSQTQDKQLKEIGDIFELFSLAYKENYGKKPQVSAQQKRELQFAAIDLGGRRPMVSAIQSYFNDNSVKRKTVGDFLKTSYWKGFYGC